MAEVPGGHTEPPATAGERCVMAGLRVQDDRIAAVNASATLDELDRADQFYGALAVIAASPMFVSAAELLAGFDPAGGTP